MGGELRTALLLIPRGQQFLDQVAEFLSAVENQIDLGLMVKRNRDVGRDLAVIRVQAFALLARSAPLWIRFGDGLRC